MRHATSDCSARSDGPASAETSSGSSRRCAARPRGSGRRPRCERPRRASPPRARARRGTSRRSARPPRTPPVSRPRPGDGRPAGAAPGRRPSARSGSRGGRTPRGRARRRARAARRPACRAKEACVGRDGAQAGGLDGELHVAPASRIRPLDRIAAPGGLRRKLRRLRLRESTFDLGPVDDVPPCLEVGRALVLVLEVVGVLPDVDAEQRHVGSA